MLFALPSLSSVSNSPLVALSPLRSALAAWLLVLMTVLSIPPGLGLAFPAWPAGVAAWMAALLLWSQLDRRQHKVASVLVGLGSVATLWAMSHGKHYGLADLLGQNTGLLGMLAAVSFLQLVVIESEDKREELPRGPGALWRTLLGVHIFGAMINLSALFIVADRISGAAKPTHYQFLVITRAFCTAALWSPFFAAMAVVLTYSPGMNMIRVALISAPFAAVMLYLGGSQLLRQSPDKGADFVGYPMHFGALWLPALLAVMVMAAHHWRPGWSSLAVIALVAPNIVVATLLVRHGLADTAGHLVDHARLRLPAMSGELVLFLAAAVFATGLQGLASLYGGWQPFSHFGGLEAILTMAMMLGLALLGFHPVIAVAMASAWLAPLHPNPDFLGLLFLLSWGLGVLCSPMSGTYLALQGRYGVSSAALARDNFTYVLQGFGLGALWLLAMAEVVRV